MCICYIDRVNISVAAIVMQKEFGWDNATKGLVLSSFLAGYMVLQVLGGVLANRYGGRLVLGVSVLLWSVFTLLTPLAAYTSLSILILTRILMGLGEGAAFPASYNIVANWSPKPEQTSSVGLIISSASIGTVIALLSTGWLIARFGWPWVFYIFGGLGIVWTFLWFKLTPNESEASNASTDTQSPKSLRSIPWGQIFSQRPVWAILVASCSAGWTLYVFLSWLPSYFNDTFGLSLSDSSVYAAFPWMVLFVMQNTLSWLVSRMLKNGAGLTRVRRLVQFTGQIGSAVLLVALIYVESSDLALLVVCLVFITIAFNTPGYAANIIDVAPKYSDVLSGVVVAAASVAGLVSVTLAGLIIEWTNSYEVIFLMTAAQSTLSALVWYFWCSGEEIILSDPLPIVDEG